MSSETLPASKTHPAGSLRELLHVAFPLVVSAGTLSFAQVVDRAFLAHAGVNEIAAAMPAAMLNWTSLSLGFGIAGYTNAFVSQYEGAGRKDRVVASLWQGLFMALINSILILPLIFVSPTIFGWMQHDPEVQKLEVEYFTTLCPVAIPMLLNTVFSAFFTCRKRTIVVMWVDVVISLLNIPLTWIMVFGKLGAPALGIQGAGLSTTISIGVGTILFAIMAIRDCKRDNYPLWESFGLDLSLLKRMIRFGLPNGVQTFLDVGVFTLFVAITGALGKTEQAATNLAFTLNSLAFIPIVGMGTAVMSLVGLRVGEGRADLASKTVWKAFAFAGSYMFLFAVIYLSVPDLILSPFISGENTDYTEMRPIIFTLLKFVAVYTIFDSMAIIFGAAIRGAGDTLFSLIFSVGCGWLVLMLPTVLVFRNGGGLYGCWAACTAFVIVLGLGFMLRFIQGKWMNMHVIEQTPAVILDGDVNGPLSSADSSLPHLKTNAATES